MRAAPGRLYLHLPPGRADGWPRRRLRLGPLPRQLELTGAFVLPNRSEVPYTRSGGHVTLELAHLAADPVLSIVAIDAGEGQVGAPAPA